MGESLKKKTVKRRPAVKKTVAHPRQSRVVASVISPSRKPRREMHEKIAYITEILALSAATYLVIIVTIALALAGFTTGLERYL